MPRQQPPGRGPSALALTAFFFLCALSVSSLPSKAQLIPPYSGSESIGASDANVFSLVHCHSSEDWESEESAGVELESVQRYRDEQLMAKGTAQITCELPKANDLTSNPSTLHLPPSVLTLPLGPRHSTQQSPLVNHRVLALFHAFTYSYSMLYQPLSEDPTGEDVSFMLLHRNTRDTETGAPTSAFFTVESEVRHVRVGGERDTTPRDVARVEHDNGIHSGYLNARHTPMSPANPQRQQQWLRRMLMRVYSTADASFQYLLHIPYFPKGTLWQWLYMRRLAVEYTVTESERMADPNRGQSTIDMLREGRERVVHLLSFPPVQLESGELQCSVEAIRRAQHHYLRDPLVVLVNQRLSAATPSDQEAAWQSESQQQSSAGGHEKTGESVLDSVLGYDRTSRRTSSSWGEQAPLFTSVFVNGLSASTRLLGSLFGSSSSRSSVYSQGPPLSPSQVAAMGLLQHVVPELGPSSSPHQRACRRAALKLPESSLLLSPSLFSTTMSTLDVVFPLDFVSAGTGEGPPKKWRRPKYVYMWKASLPATRSVCISVEPTQERKQSVTLHITEDLVLDRGTIGLVVAIGILSWWSPSGHSSPRFSLDSFMSVLLMAFLFGFCGLLVLVGAIGFYILQSLPRMQLGKASIVVLLTMGGLAAVLDGLLSAASHVVWLLDASVVDWRLYVSGVVVMVSLTSSLLVHRFLSTTSVGVLTSISRSSVRVLLLGIAAYRHCEALAACGAVYALLSVPLSLALWGLWLHHNPCPEDPPAKNVWRALAVRWSHRQRTAPHFTLKRVLLRFLRRVLRMMLAVLLHAAELDVDESSADVSPRHSGDLSSGSEPSLRNGQGNMVVPTVVSPEATPRGSVCMRRSSLQRLIAVSAVALMQRAAASLEQRKHPHRYASSSSNQHRQMTPTEAVQQRLSERLSSASGVRGSGGAGWLWSASSGSSDDDMDAESGSHYPPGQTSNPAFTKPSSRASASYFQYSINDPLAVFPNSVYEGTGTRSTLLSRPISHDAYRRQGEAYTRDALAGLASHISRSDDKNYFVLRLRRPEEVLRWADKAADDESE